MIKNQKHLSREFIQMVIESMEREVAWGFVKINFQNGKAKTISKEVTLIEEPEK